MPAGTYNADVVNMTMSETVILHEAGTAHIAAKDQLISFTAG